MGAPSPSLSLGGRCLSAQPEYHQTCQPASRNCQATKSKFAPGQPAFRQPALSCLRCRPLSPSLPARLSPSQSLPPSRNAQPMHIDARGNDAGTNGFWAPPGCILESCVRAGRVLIEVERGQRPLPASSPKSTSISPPAPRPFASPGLSLLDYGAGLHRALTSPSFAPAFLLVRYPALCGRTALQFDRRPHLDPRHRSYRPGRGEGIPAPLALPRRPPFRRRAHLPPGTARKGFTPLGLPSTASHAFL